MAGENEVNTQSYDYILGEIHSELKGIKKDQVESNRALNDEISQIKTRLNNQNGQIRAMSIALDRNTQAITEGKPADNARQIQKIEVWCKDHDEKEESVTKEKKRSTIDLRNAIIGGLIITVFSAGLTLLIIVWSGGHL
jgi:hypothetical protein